MYEIRRTPYKDPPALWDGANNSYKYSNLILNHNPNAFMKFFYWIENHSNNIY